MTLLVQAVVDDAAVVGCGGCVIIADVAGIVWYSEVFINTAATAVVGVNTGNGSRVTRTSIIQNEGQFTFNPAAGTAAYGTPPSAVTSVGFDSVTTIAGATLTSPTAYNIFTAYTLSSQSISGGICQTTTYTSKLDAAYTETLATAGGQVTLDLEGERGFISFLGFTSCSSGGENAQGTVLAQVQNLTVSTTMFYSSIALAMSVTLAPTTNPSSTSRLPLKTTTLTDVLTTLTATLSGSSTITPAPTSLSSASAPNIVIGNTTITPSGNPLGLSFITGNSTASPAPTGTGAGGTGVVTGGGGGNNTIPYTGDAPSWKNGVSLWGSTLLVSVMAVGWIL
ncbi:MAG: hypothetical protein Q9181_002886 [Wetmoreana brouardii]